MANKEEVIGIQEIKSILNHYRIGKKPLAKLLGWGETTIIRYIDGDVPTKEYSDKLKLLLENPLYYYELLLKNKDRLTEVAFKKSQKAVFGKLTESKIRITAQFFINYYQGEITPSQIQTLLYFAQGFFLGFYDMALFEDEYKISTNNCPYPILFSEFSNVQMKCFEMSEEFFTKQEKELLTKVAQAFSWYGSKALYVLGTKEMGFLKISRDKENRKVVTENAIRTHFKKIMEQDGVKELDDIDEYIEKYILELKHKE